MLLSYRFSMWKRSKRFYADGLLQWFEIYLARAVLDVVCRSVNFKHHRAIGILMIKMMTNTSIPVMMTSMSMLMMRAVTPSFVRLSMMMIMMVAIQLPLWGWFVLIMMSVTMFLMVVTLPFWSLVWWCSWRFDEAGWPPSTPMVLRCALYIAATVQ